MRTKKFVLLCLLVSALFLSLWPLQRPLRAFRSTVLDATFPFFAWLHRTSSRSVRLAEEMNILRTRALLEEQTHLNIHIARLEEAALGSEEIRLENERLRRLLDFKTDLAHKVVAGRVVLNQSARWVQYLVLDVGTADKIDRGAVVMVSEGLVGRVTEAGDHSSQVMLITDPDSAVSVLIQRSRVQGVFVGRPDGTGSVKYLPHDADVQEGDIVLTSGLGGVFPKGIRTGTVASVKPHPGGLFKTVRIRPSVNFSRIEEVVCIPSR